jgi:hypothetical protein
MLEAKEKHVIHLADVRPEPIDWLWPGHIAAGKLTLIDGDPGLGKSLITLDLAARLTTGRPFPDGSACAAPAGVVLVGSEDGVSDTIIGRLQAAGADLNHVHSFDGTSRPGTSKGPPTFPEDCSLLEEVIQESKARLVIVDPLLAFISSSVWSVNDQSVRGALAPLARVTEKTRASMGLVRHLTKWGSGRRAIYRGSGSIGIIGSARTAFLVGRDPEQPELRVLACTKNNLGAPPPSLGFRIVADKNGWPRIEWTGPVEITAEDLVQVPSYRRGELLARAVVFLEKLLATGPRLRDWGLRQTRAFGISSRTLERARAQLGVQSKEVRENGQNVWYWSLPSPKAAEEEAIEFPADGSALPATEEQRRRLDEALKM